MKVNHLFTWLILRAVRLTTKRIHFGVLHEVSSWWCPKFFVSFLTLIHGEMIQFDSYISKKWFSHHLRDVLSSMKFAWFPAFPWHGRAGHPPLVSLASFLDMD